MVRHHRRIGFATSLAGSFIFSLAAASTATADAKPLYSKHCAQCHGEDGRGDTPAGRAMELSSIAGIEEAVSIALVRKDPRHGAASEALDDSELAAIAALIASF